MGKLVELEKAYDSISANTKLLKLMDNFVIRNKIPNLDIFAIPTEMETTPYVSEEDFEFKYYGEKSDVLENKELISFFKIMDYEKLYEELSDEDNRKNLLIFNSASKGYLILICNCAKQHNTNKMSWIDTVEETYVKDKIKYDYKSKWRNLYKQECELLESEVEQFNKVTDFYNALVSQKILNSGRYYQDAFYIKLYMRQRLQEELLCDKLNEKYDVFDMNFEDVIEKMYNIGESRETIESCIALNCRVQEKRMLSYECNKYAFDLVDKTLSLIKSKSLLEKLEKLDNSISENKKSIVDIDLMSGAEFEKFIAELLNKFGFNAQATKLSGDQGVDVIATKNDIKIAIQTKCYSMPVGNNAIQEAVAGKAYYHADKCMVITNSIFTKSAKNLAKANDVELWDREVLIEKLEEL